ncbi:MAG: GIY-YIG nuclease family protein [Candidatus Paceibacterota bacterium]
MKFFVYFLKSLKNNDIYIGSTSNIDRRVALHNAGRVKSTKGYCPWQLLEYKEYPSRSESMKAELFYKTGQQKEILRKKYGLVAKW